jgi:hypothetical protein
MENFKNVFDCICRFKQPYHVNHSELDRRSYKLLFLTMTDTITSQKVTFPPESPCIRNSCDLKGECHDSTELLRKKQILLKSQRPCTSFKTVCVTLKVLATIILKVLWSHFQLSTPRLLWEKFSQRKRRAQSSMCCSNGEQGKQVRRLTILKKMETQQTLKEKESVTGIDSLKIEESHIFS